VLILTCRYGKYAVFSYLGTYLAMGAGVVWTPVQVFFQCSPELYARRVMLSPIGVFFTSFFIFFGCGFIGSTAIWYRLKRRRGEPSPFITALSDQVPLLVFGTFLWSGLLYTCFEALTVRASRQPAMEARAHGIACSLAQAYFLGINMTWGSTAKVAGARTGILRAFWDVLRDNKRQIIFGAACFALGFLSRIGMLGCDNNIETLWATWCAALRAPLSCPLLSHSPCHVPPPRSGRWPFTTL
jgi:hypothetical protein